MQDGKTRPLRRWPRRGRIYLECGTTWRGTTVGHSFEEAGLESWKAISLNGCIIGDIVYSGYGKDEARFDHGCSGGGINWRES